MKQNDREQSPFNSTVLAQMRLILLLFILNNIDSTSILSYTTILNEINKQ